MIIDCAKHIRRILRLLCFAAICVRPCCSQSSAQSNTDGARRLPNLSNGWSQWAIDAPEGASNWCCFDAMANTLKTCNLDSPSLNFGSVSDGSNTATRPLHTSTMHIYAKIAQGSLQRLRVFGADCPVSADTPIAALGNIATSSSLAWLNTVSASTAMKEAQILPALAMHNGAAPILFALAKRDTAAGIRRQSWFWLSQINATDLEREAMLALRVDPPARSESNAIIFALSQLQAPRAGTALIAIVEDKKLTIKLRKEALFWLGQLEGDQGLNYLDRMLGSH